MTTIMDLPIDIIYIILQQKIIDITDVINFGLTCRRFNDALNNNLLWRTKLYQIFDIKWPYLKKIYDNRIQNKESINFKDEVKTNVNAERIVRKALFSYLSLLSETLFNYGSSQLWEPCVNNSCDTIFDRLFFEFHSNIGPHTMNYHFLKDELLYQIKMSPLHPKCNLTHQYYSKIFFPFLQRHHLENVLLEFINYPKEQQLFENAATIVAQWYQPQKFIYNYDIEASLDAIAQQTLNSLKKAHWDHPIFSTSAKQFSFWKYNNIDDNKWSKIEEKQIIDVLLTVLFDELGFHLHNIHNPKLEDIFINCVLESKIGNALTLSIIFQSVARRLGVPCDLVCSDFGWLCWNPKSVAENPEDEKYFYIDILHGGTIRGRNDCALIQGYKKHREICPTRMVFFNELQRNIIINQNWTPQKFSLLKNLYIETDSIDAMEMLYRNHFNDKMSMSHILFSCRASLRRMQNDYNIRKSEEVSSQTILWLFENFIQYRNENPFQIDRNIIVPKNRKENIKYAVGMIVTCIKNDLNQTGVIIGWDEQFNYHVKIKYNCTTVLSNSQTCDTEQPFYIILSEDGNVYYAAQGTLIDASPRWIEHSEIGRYFCRFTNVYYVPNEVLTAHYPYDQAILNIYYSSS